MDPTRISADTSCLFERKCVWSPRKVAKAELSDEADSENYRVEAPKTGYVLYFIGLDVHKKTTSYCVKDSAGRVHQKGKIRSTRRELDLAGSGLFPNPDDRHGSDDLYRLDI